MLDRSNREIHRQIQKLQSLVSNEFGAWSAELTMTQERIDAYAMATGDNQWQHTDPIRAQSGPFGRTIAQGGLVSSLTAELLRAELNEVLSICQGGVMYMGSTCTSLYRVCPAETIRARGKIESVVPAASRSAKVTYGFEIELGTGRNKPVARGQLLFTCIAK
jgi:acyl dehydratase